MYIDKFIIKKTSAGETYGKYSRGPIEVDRGALKTRLNFLQDQTVASVYVETIGRSPYGILKFLALSSSTKFVKCRHNNKTIFINVNSLSKRIGIAPHEIRKANLDVLIQHCHASLLSTQSKVDAYFKKVLQDYQNQTSEDKAEIYKMIGIAAFIGFSGKEHLDEIGYLLKNKKILHLKAHKKDQLVDINLISNKVFGKGSFGSVRVVNEISKGRVSIAKIAHDKTAVEDAKNEHAILSHLHESRASTGIQRQPYSLFDFRLANSDINPNYSGYYAPMYDKDLFSVKSSLKPKEKIQCARQLLHGLVEMERQQIAHGDIKDENCLFKRKNENEFECVIADFGGARNLKEKMQKTSSFTPYYLCKEDDVAHADIYQKFKSAETEKKKARLRNAAKALLLKRDVYAMGIVLSELVKDDCFKSWQEQNNFNYLTIKMKDTSWKTRFSASAALQEFNQIFPS